MEMAWNIIVEGEKLRKGKWLKGVYIGGEKQRNVKRQNEPKRRQIFVTFCKPKIQII